ncbi:Aspartate/methionine/tyrosine aminotransferase [Pilibacter termitis]|uniref:Aminotransferase n=1 Tax=Pilibacter termitis TaxID=263852 RepID=A0A1T4L4W8_9ENTE|nr:aminotransferase [Pilibacter termitis]SJZ49744.1 Aspartate/methionine/tyrosine aminotransferase [Pilibacter termitis]
MKIANFGVEEWLNKYEKRAKIDISQSSISAFTLEELLNLDGTSVEEFFKERATLSLDYGWIEGSEEFKRLVASLYQNLTEENILQTNGATGANLLAIYALVNSGDHVISMLPSYQQLYEIPKSIGANVDFVELKEEKNWSLDLEELRAKIQSNTKMICLNNANNPTGTLLERSDLLAIAEMAREVDAYVLVDEVYAPLGEGDFVSIADIYERGISTNSLSKTYSLPGIRIGWVATSAEITEEFRKYRDYTMICGGVLSDELAIHALKNKAAILRRNKKIVAENLQILKNWVESEPRVTLVAPNFVSTSFIKLDIPQKDEEFCLDLLNETGVLLVPGSAFDRPNHARVGYCCKKEELLKGLELLSDYLRKFDK